MAAPTVAPKEIGSMPCSLQIRLAYCRASRSPTPLAAPRAQAASYSRPPEAPQYSGLLTTEKWVSSILAMRPQAMVQPKQAALVTSWGLPSEGGGSCMASPEILPATSNWTSRWLRVGRAPISLITFIRTWVPYLGSPWPVTALSARICFFSAVTLRNSGKSRIPERPLVPRMATALRFFEPITAPTPERPAARCRSLTTAA